MKRVAVLGLGYVGMVQIAALSKSGVRVSGFDNKPSKNELLRRGESTIVEPGVSESIAEHRDRISVPETFPEAIKEADLCYVCVGTPPKEDGSVDLASVLGVARDFGSAIKNDPARKILVIRSTIPPWTSREAIQEVERASGKKFGPDFGCVMHPEFMREGSSLEDFMNPSFTILGTSIPQDAAQIEELYRRIGVKGDFFVVSFEEAELFKYLNNNFHALKVAFANEVSHIAAHYGFDPMGLMKIFIRDTKLNISPYYLLPGMPFGGYCLPKDTLGLKRLLDKEQVELRLIPAIGMSNENHYAFLFKKIEEVLSLWVESHNGAAPRLGILGIAFKKGTDDLRESPYLRLFQYLKSRGYAVSFFDPLVRKSLFIGMNLKYVESIFKNFFEFQKETINDFLNEADVVILGCGNGLEDLEKNGMPKDKVVVILDPALESNIKKMNIQFKSILRPNGENNIHA